MDSGARIGPGKALLLENIHSAGSISAAARAMGMDYKRAWALLDSINQAFKSPAVELLRALVAADHDHGGHLHEALIVIDHHADNRCLAP